MLSLDLAARPATGTYLLLPGHYRVVVVAVAANAKLVRKTIDVRLTGNWFWKESEMFQHGIRIQVLP